MSGARTHTDSSEIRQALADAVERAAARPDGPGLMRIGVPVPHVDAFRWLAAQHPGSRAVWSPRDTHRVVAMCGIADVYESVGKTDVDRLSRYISHQLEGADPGTRYYGGIRFDSGRTTSPEWNSFGSVRFVLPRFELVVDDTGAELVCNLVRHRDRASMSTILREIRELVWPGAAQSSMLPHAVARHDEPDRPQWLQRVAESLEAIEALEIQKVVLARRSSFEFDGPVRPFELVARLYHEAPNRFHYLVETEDGSVFLGATPERLVKREQSFVFTEAVAGTRPAVEDEADDAALLAALMASDKEQREHLCVRWAIEEILRPLCEDLAVDAHASEMRLSQGRHLVSRFNGVLNDGVETWQLLRHLHPTPAVGGYPAPAAIRVIRRMEAFDRGWYAGPIGWVGRDEAEFAVALRCALVQGSSMHIYSGAGIVAGSEPQAEWDEIEHKIVDFARVLGLAGVEAE
ncbi:MAG: isochorismate synthase [Rhodothermales bacterium]|nr:isochorismate synthase [Rhodothermales bacterium]MBO6779598.1 isochorismate synthase [Rhodothermales bacterium]